MDWHLDQYKMPNLTDKTFDDQNRLAILYDRNERVGRGWMSFIDDQEYFSFNMANEYVTSLVLLKQNHGSQDSPKWWDIYWTDRKHTLGKILEKMMDLGNHNYPYNTAPLPDIYSEIFGDHIPSDLPLPSSRQAQSSTNHPFYDAERERKLNFRKEDGLFQYVLGNYAHNYTLKHQFLMLLGHRNTKNYATISVTFQFSWRVLHNIIHAAAMPMIAARTINVSDIHF